MDNNVLGPTEHSDLVGGSSAAKRLACPGSYQMEKKLPESARRGSSKDADEGSALHDCMAYILDNDITDPQEVVGMIFGNNQPDRESFRMEQDLVNECIAPAMKFFDELLVDANDEVDFLIEKRCELPGIPGAFGTSDLIARDHKNQKSIILDWKFGAGVPVKAYYVDADGKKVPNAQLMFYARAAMHTYPDMFEDRPTWPVELIIVQPRGRATEYTENDTGEVVTVEMQRYTRITVTVQEIEQFRFDLVRAVAEATGKDPRIAKGEHCRFASCKTICPLWTGPALDLTKMHDALMVKESPDYAELDALTPAAWGDLYAQLLEWCEIAAPLIKEIQSQAHAFVEDEGEVIPDWKMVTGRSGNRAWYDDDKAEKWLARQGVPLEERRVTKVISVAAAEKALKKIGKDLKADYVNPGAPGKPKLARADDHRAEVIAPAVLVKQLASKLATLQG